jgi:hypothetical protein
MPARPSVLWSLPPETPAATDTPILSNVPGGRPAPRTGANTLLVGHFCPQQGSPGGAKEKEASGHIQRSRVGYSTLTALVSAATIAFGSCANWSATPTPLACSAGEIANVMNCSSVEMLPSSGRTMT